MVMAYGRPPARTLPTRVYSDPAKRGIHLAVRKKTKRAQPRRPVGRPSLYSLALAREICERVSDGEILGRICNRPGMPSRVAIYKWLHDGKHQEFVEMYGRARLNQANSYAEDLVRIADESTSGTATEVQAARLRFDARRWAAARIHPKAWGDHVSHEVTGAGGRAVEIDVRASLAEKIREIAERSRALAAARARDEAQ